MSTPANPRKRQHEVSVPCRFPFLAFLAAGLGACHRASKRLHPPFRSVSPHGFRDRFCFKRWPLGFANRFKNPQASSRAGADAKGLAEVCPFGSEELPTLAKNGRCSQIPAFPSGGGLGGALTPKTLLSAPHAYSEQRRVGGRQGGKATNKGAAPQHQETCSLASFLAFGRSFFSPPTPPCKTAPCLTPLAVIFSLIHRRLC